MLHSVPQGVLSLNLAGAHCFTCSPLTSVLLLGHFSWNCRWSLLCACCLSLCSVLLARLGRLNLPAVERRKGAKHVAPSIHVGE